MPNYAALKAEIVNDPTGKGYSSKTDQQVADALNAPTEAKVNPLIPLTQLAVWAAKTGVRSKIASAQAQQSPVWGVCLTVMDLLTGLNGPPLDLSVADNLAMLDALVAYGVISAADKASLLAIQTTLVSRASLVAGWGIPVQAPDITYARAH